ncbi:MAG: AmmeMemoRadiSam system protein A [Candidatus Omnitrophica bacterium]|nr:AmmeMemoRadiSam system protein A [Candidatus Omnitrophota bacterium]
MYTDRIGGEVNILKYANSGDTAGDKTKVVGYMSAVAFKEENANKKETLMDHPTLTDSDKKVLLHIARLTLENYLRDQPVPEFEQGSPILYEKRGAFVTLKEHGQLRGCIGRIVADTPLYKVISDFAINAAVHDMRFKPVEYKELKDIEIEISVLTPFERVQSLDEIEVGTHGLMIQKGPYSGLLLPQVPLEYHWDRDTFLEHLCYKAGLPSGAYKDKDAVIYRFSASVFSEKEFK